MLEEQLGGTFVGTCLFGSTKISAKTGDQAFDETTAIIAYFLNVFPADFCLLAS